MRETSNPSCLYMDAMDKYVAGIHTAMTPSLPRDKIDLLKESPKKALLFFNFKENRLCAKYLKNFFLKRIPIYRHFSKLGQKFLKFLFL